MSLTIRDLIRAARTRIREIQPAEALLRLGFVNPMSLDHGILGWGDAGHAVAVPADAPPAHTTGLASSTCC